MVRALLLGFGLLSLAACSSSWDPVDHDGDGFSALDAMQAVVAGETVQIVSLCRPLISEPDLPRKMREGASEEALCSRCGSCWPEYAGEGIACHNSEVRALVGLPTI